MNHMTAMPTESIEATHPASPIGLTPVLARSETLVVQLPSPVSIHAETDWVAIGGPFIGIVTVVVTAYFAWRSIKSHERAVLAQIQANHESAIEAQREMIRQGLKVEIYKEAIGRVREYQDGIADLHSSYRGVHMDLGFYLDGIRLRGPEISWYEMSKQSLAVYNSGVFYLLDHYQVVFGLQKQARELLSDLGENLHKSSEAYNRAVEPYLPTKDIQGNVLVDQPVVALQAFRSQGVRTANPKFAEIDRLFRAFEDAYFNLMGVVADLGIEIQDRLIGGLFGKQVVRRKPTDPKIKTLKFED